MKYDIRVNEFKNNAFLEEGLSSFVKANKFNGPSLYFHSKAINICRRSAFKGELREDLLEAIYATLVSWGMHRMGMGGPKMVSYEEFKGSVNSVLDKLEKAKNYRYDSMDGDKWSNVEAIYKAVKIMGNFVGRDLDAEPQPIKTIIVANSKVLSHLLPDLIAPIDRQYTINFLRGNKVISTKEAYQWSDFLCITKEFYHEVINLDNVADFYDKNKSKSPWNTSILKFVDNVIIGKMVIKSPSV
ncbi:hypothetical protein OVA03_12780 [Asticcacaulis sp. SL142]|uniref:hypothetical protein n=1 Tax=Asticcacaulis sp. SL142 TaxID=2995155 RepID=UPI00226C998C|nr:hypothetical protein [Asticcacaulis sp. SL142]WAC47571.1 hypothetical protein OVA03_12780 [Asticcacaulis sp. SL142]